MQASAPTASALPSRSGSVQLHFQSRALTDAYTVAVAGIQRAMSLHLVFDPTAAPDSWRYTCPAGHHGWRATPNGFHCDSCARHAWGRDAYFERLTDQKTGRRYPRERVTIQEGAK